MLVSAIVPVHDGEQFLAEALESIRLQRYPHLEIIIVDDGSTDGTVEVVRRLGGSVVFERQQQRGPAAARNRGLALAHGELVAFLDADDVWPAGTLHARVERMRLDPALDVALGHISPIGPSSAPDADTGGQEAVIGVHLGAGLFRADVFHRVGPFSEDLEFSEDHDWFLRAREQGARIAVIDMVTLLYRRHPGAMTRVRRHNGYGLTRVLKASLDRRREQAGAVARSLPRISDFEEARATPARRER